MEETSRNEADKAIDALTSRHGELERERATHARAAQRGRASADAARMLPAIANRRRSTAPRAAGAANRGAPTRAPSLSARAAVEVTASRPPVELPPAVIAAEARLTEQATATREADRADADVTPRPMPARRCQPSCPAQTASTFDELAFLSSVVDTPTGTVDVPAPTDRPDERARRDSFAQRATEDGIVNLANDPGTMLERPDARSAGSPLAMNVSGNNPIVIKDKTTEAAKTLKCAECGAMNYPTEWYCERCGAELASL